MKRHLRRKVLLRGRAHRHHTVYDQRMVDVVASCKSATASSRTGCMDYATQLKCGLLTPPPQNSPWLFTVHGTGTT